jgi:hypothetical protein
MRPGQDMTGVPRVAIVGAVRRIVPQENRMDVVRSVHLTWEVAALLKVWPDTAKAAPRRAGSCAFT